MSEMPETEDVTEPKAIDSTTKDQKMDMDPEKQRPDGDESPNATKTSVYKNLGWLDRFLAVWIFLAMAIGIILGEFVSNVGPALQKSTFVGVSVPIGKFNLSL